MNRWAVWIGCNLNNTWDRASIMLRTKNMYIYVPCVKLHQYVTCSLIFFLPRPPMRARGWKRILIATQWWSPVRKVRGSFEKFLEWNRKTIYIVSKLFLFFNIFSLKINALRLARKPLWKCDPSRFAIKIMLVPIHVLMTKINKSTIFTSFLCARFSLFRLLSLPTMEISWRTEICNRWRS